MAEQHFAISLVLHQDENLGWRVHTIAPNGQHDYPVDVKGAENIARVVGDAVGQAIQPTPFEIVRGGTEAVKEAAAVRLKAAEAQAATIPTLRKALAEWE